MLINFSHFTLHGYQHNTVYPINAYNYDLPKIKGQSVLLHGNCEFKETKRLSVTVFPLASFSYLGNNTNKWNLIADGCKATFRSVNPNGTKKRM